MFPSVKSAIGWYAAFRRGPKLAQQELQPRIQEQRVDAGGDWVAMAKVLTRVCREHKADLDAVLAWASTADAGSDGLGGSLMGALRAALVAEGMVSERVKPAECERHTWTDYEGNTYTTTRAK